MSKIQYAEVPIKYLELRESSNNSIKLNVAVFLHQLRVSRFNPFSRLKEKSVIVKIKNDKNPFVEEIFTKNKIGLNRCDGYRIYLKGNAIYNLCTKSEAYVKMYQNVSYRKFVKRLFKF